MAAIPIEHELSSLGSKFLHRNEIGLELRNKHYVREENSAAFTLRKYPNQPTRTDSFRGYRLAVRDLNFLRHASVQHFKAVLIDVHLERRAGVDDPRIKSTQLEQSQERKIQSFTFRSIWFLRCGMVLSLYALVFGNSCKVSFFSVS